MDHCHAIDGIIADAVTLIHSACPLISETLRFRG